MRKIIVQEFISLDGVMQAPGGPEEDASESFVYGGWTAPYFEVADRVADEFMQDWMHSTDILLGRVTYDIFAGYWPYHADMWPGIMDVTKYVLSNTLAENTTEWPNVTFVKGVDDIKRLKESDGGDITVHGSSKVAQLLFKHDLVDELRLITYPVILGKGKKLFDGESAAGAYEMIKNVVASNGVIFASYKRSGDVATGTVGE